MTAKQFYDWQTAGGTDDVMRLVDCLERADVAWCAIGGVAVNHWAAEPMVTQDVDFVVASDAVERAVVLLEEAGFRSERFEWSVNFAGRSAVSLQLSTEDFYREFPSRAVAADVHGILLRVASLDDTLREDQGVVRTVPATEQASEGRGGHRAPGGGAPAPLGGPAGRAKAAGASNAGTAGVNPRPDACPLPCRGCTGRTCPPLSVA